MGRLGKWIEPFPDGIYVRPADAWIDPAQPKPVALVTHGHGVAVERVIAEILRIAQQFHFAIDVAEGNLEERGSIAKVGKVVAERFEIPRFRLDTEQPVD